MKLTSHIIKLLLVVVVALACFSTAAQAQQEGPSLPKKTGPPAAPPPPKALSYKVLSEPSAPAGWKRYQFGAEPIFSVILPGQPEANVEQKSLGGAKPSTMRAYTATTNEAVYTAYYAEDLPFVAERMPESLKQSLYDGMLKGFMKGLEAGMQQSGMLFKLEMGQRRKSQLGGLEGVEFEFIFGPMKGLARVSLAGQRAYMAISILSEAASIGEQAAFFNSFRIHAK